MSSSPLARFGVAGSALLLFIVSFFPWYHLDLGEIGVGNANGWHQIGVAAWIFTILLLLVEAARLSGVVPAAKGLLDLASLALSALTLLFLLIFLILRLFGSSDLPSSENQIPPGWGAWVGLVLFLCLAASTVVMFLQGDAMRGLKQLQAQSGASNTPPPPPPAPPTA